MANTVLYMSMSLDGFIAGPDDDLDNGLGTGGEQLHDWLELSQEGNTLTFSPQGKSAEVFEESMATGAVLTGRRTFDHGGQWGGDHHDGVPIFVPTRGEPPAPISENVHYVTDGAASAARQAKEAAGDKDVMVHGADLAQSLLREGALDFMEIHLIPVLLGEGRSLFGHLGVDPIQLQLVRIRNAPGVTHLRFRVVP